jgi:hypothetical protein
MSSDNPLEGGVKAEFVTGPDGPESVEGRSAKHYKVKLSLTSSHPDLSRVVYKLDPSTYYDAVRESTDSSRNFEVELTSYGNYPVQVEALIGKRSVRTKTSLIDLLDASYSRTDDGRILQALKDIREH